MYKVAILNTPEAITMSPAKRWRSSKAILLALTSIAFTFASSAVAQSSGTVDFGAAQVPAVKDSLTVIRVSPHPAPSAFLQETLGKMGAPANKIGRLADSPLFAESGKNIPPSTMGLVENGQLHAYWDLKSGDAEIFPALGNKAAAANANTTATLKQNALTAAQQLFGRADIIPHDATQFTVGEPRQVMGSDASKSADTGSVTESGSSVYLTYVSLQRKVDGIAVYGPGSNASLAFGNDGTVQGFVKRWGAGVAGGTVKETRTTDEVKGEIQKLLQPLAASGNVTVRSIELAYYDNQGDTIQPAYRITAQVHFIPQAVPGVKPAGQTTHDELVVRYLAIGGGTLGIDEGAGLPTNTDKPVAPANIPANDPTVGRYVVRNDDAGWVNSANGFWNNITGSPNGWLFTNSQYYWAYPYEFNTSELSFINSVQVGLTEVHGNWWYFTTYQNWGDGVDITAIPASEGYGSAAGGQLNYWILHSCEVVPSAIDAPCATDSRSWWTPWFNIFKGLHTVVGYRTIMYINDGVTSPFAHNLELGAPVISAWFNAANSASDYSGNPTDTAHCGTKLPMGRPSAVTVCGHNNDNIFNQEAIPAAGCLTNYWQPN